MRTKCVKNVTFAIEKLKLRLSVCFQMPPRPKLLFGQWNVVTFILNICKGCRGSRGLGVWGGGAGLYKPKKISDT